MANDKGGGSALTGLANFIAPDTMLKVGELQKTGLVNQALQNKLLDENNQRSAASHYLGGRDPNSADPTINWSPDAPPTGTYQQQDENGNWKTRSLFGDKGDAPDDSGAVDDMGVPTGNRSLFGSSSPKAASLFDPDAPQVVKDMASPQQQAQAFGRQQANNLRQAAPDAFLSTAVTRAIQGPMLEAAGFTPSQITSWMLAPKESGDAYAKSQFPQVPQELQIVKGLQDRLAAMAPDDPQRGALESLLQKTTMADWQDPLKRADLLASIGQKTADTNLANARTGQISQGTFNDGDIRDLAQRYYDTGDKSLMTTLGRGTQGASNLVRFQKAVGDIIHENGGSQREIEMANNGIKTAGATLTAFSKGKEGGLVRSGNAATSHLLTLESLGDALDNGNVQLANQIANQLGAAFGDPNVTSYEGAAKLVGDELNKFIAGGPGAHDDRAQYAKTLGSALSPQQRKANINALKGLMVGQLRALQTQYHAGTGANDFADKYLEPEVAGMLSNQQYAPGGNPTRAPATPSAGAAVIPPAASRKVGQVYPTPKGNLKWTGTGWVQP